MLSEIEINGAWFDCTFLYPNQEPPISVAGPMGTKSWQQSLYSRFNAKLTFRGSPQTVPPGQYRVRSGSKEYTFYAQKPEGDVVWGDVR